MPSKNDINPQTGKPYAVNPATGQWDDNYWSTVVEPKLRAQYGAGSAEGTTADQLIQASIEKYTQLADQYNQKLTEFDTKNPFVFDKILEEETANVTQRLDPYYTQTLSDFLTGVETKRTRSIADRDRLLSELQQDTDSFTGDAKIALDSAVNKSREGYADAGLYGSGQQLSGEGEIAANASRRMDQFNVDQNRTRQNIETSASRLGEDLGTQQRLGVRDINREKSYNIESQSLAETLRRQTQREFEKAQYAGIPPGVDPNSFQNYTFGLLR